MKIINLDHLTKKYSPNMGCFDLSLKVAPGEVYGFIGPNGAGKTTVIRQMMGFIKPDRGSASILNYDSWRHSSAIMLQLGYLAGEISLPPYLTGKAYLQMMAQLRPQVQWEYVEKLINYFDLSPKQRIGKMSKGNKQKVAIIGAFMHKPEVLVLDEPTSGLDPLMQEKFNTLIGRAKEQGATIFISSHIFGEVEANCDRVGFIKKGRLIEEVVIKDMQMKADKIYELQFGELGELKRFLRQNRAKVKHKDLKTLILHINVPQEASRDFLVNLHHFQVNSFREIPFSLESRFLELYEDEVALDD